MHLPCKNTSWSGPPAAGAHVHKLPQQVQKPRDSLAMRKVQHSHNGRTSVNRLSLTKHEILSHYSSCFEGIGQFPGELYKFHLKPEHKPARHAPRKVPIHLDAACREEIKSFVELGILEEVTELTDWVNSYVIVEKDSGNHHAPNHTIKRKLRICLDPRDLNEALEREPYHTHSVDEITAKLKGMTVFTIVDFKKGWWWWYLIQIPGNSPAWPYLLADSNGQDCPWAQWLPRTFSNLSWMPSLLAWKVSQELLMTW